MEGHIGEVKIDNQSRLSASHATDYLKAIQPKDVIQSAPIDKALLLLMETPGISNARATLQPGASVGSSDLLIELKPSALLSGQASLDNYGNRYTGQTRFTGAAYLNSPFQRGDQLSLNLVASDSDLGYGRLAWQTPVGHSGLTLGAAYAGTRYVLGKEFANLEAHGSASIGSLIATYPFVRSASTTLSGTLTWEDKHLLDSTDTSSTRSNKTLKQWSGSLLGSHQDALLGGGISNADLTLSQGRLAIDADSDATTLSDTAKTQGSYHRIAYNLSRLQQLNHKHSLSVQVGGQLANKNLGSSEKFSIGGSSGVRAFAEGEASGDEGILGHVAWNIALSEKMQASAFYDIGNVKINHTPFNPEKNHRTLAGVGLGLNTLISKISLKATIAWRTEGESISSPDHLPRLWLQASLPF